MIKLYENGVYLLHGAEILEDGPDASAVLKSKMGDHVPAKQEAAKQTIAWSILNEHNTSGNM